MSVKEAILRGKAETVRAAAQAWTSNGHSKEDAADLGEAIALGESLSEEVASLVDRRLRELYDGKLDGRFSAHGEGLLALLEAAGLSLDAISTAALDARGAGHEDDWAARLTASRARVAAAVEKVRRKWPFFDPAKMQRSRAEIAAGQFRTLEEILGELPGAQDDRG